MWCSETRVHRHKYIYVLWNKIKVEQENGTEKKLKQNKSANKKSTLSKKGKISCGKFNATSEINFILCVYLSFHITCLPLMLLLLLLLLFICHVTRKKISLHRAFSRVFNQSKEYSFNFISFNFLVNLSLSQRRNASARCHSMTLYIECFAHLLAEKKSFLRSSLCVCVWCVCMR